jgi:hypothetical protein
MKAISDLKYHPNLHARTLAGNLQFGQTLSSLTFTEPLKAIAMPRVTKW